MSIAEFARYSNLLHALTTDFVRAVPEERWDFTPDPPGRPGRAPAPHQIGNGFAPFCKQLRHVVCVRGVYNAALATGKVDWTRKHGHYPGPLTREALLAALDAKQRDLLAALETVDIGAAIDWDGTLFTFALFTWEFVQHEAIHHGQWSVYASLAGFETPFSWRSSWGM
ncbi:MAG TPA: DinB family protein [Thermoanaerobaculia bacterium]|nr:DinB family protein [Thermoanaerobaculia bacterium]